MGGGNRWGQQDERGVTEARSASCGSQGPPERETKRMVNRTVPAAGLGEAWGPQGLGPNARGGHGEEAGVLGAA